MVGIGRVCEIEDSNVREIRYPFYLKVSRKVESKLHPRLRVRADCDVINQ